MDSLTAYQKLMEVFTQFEDEKVQEYVADAMDQLWYYHLTDEEINEINEVSK